ncbi:cyclin-like protein [Rhizophagus irregularis]|uniref:Cyclin-like protein n=1 Tax=Rhizophagus irregularis TaxID=588596 RepID=A0A2I1E541_9GLOM|nr:cyclin-like protein [Rhizophagus irregularis]PKC65397.1 cyclin-like protein [Rhizophagus irregularis]PKY17255.1 cyclin-like protein [Rhizophagus irregularis]
MSKLSLQNAILTYEQLETTPSKKDNIPEELEDELRRLGCDFIQSAGIVLRLPQVAMATAQVLFQRFFYVASLKKFSVRDIGMGALFLASKVSESPCKIRDLINVYNYLIRRYRNEPNEPLEYLGQVFYEMKDALVIAEMQILKKLGFNVHVQLPYGLMVNYLKVLELTDHETIPQKAWGYLNDSLRTNVYVCYQPATIACAVIWLAARIAQVKLPTSPPWWELFEAEHIMRLYAIRLPSNLPLSLDELEDYLKNYEDRRKSGINEINEINDNKDDLGPAPMVTM